MTTKKKNRFLTFCFSLLPGAGEMYMGFMKMGLSLMLLFFFIITFTIWIQQAVFSCLCVVVWFYGFFHANNLASLDDAQFAEVKDEYLFGMDISPGIKNFAGKYHKWIAYALILIGASLLWSTAADFIRHILPEQFEFIWRFMYRLGDYLPSIVIGCGIIILGIKMLSGKKVESVQEAGRTERKMADDGEKEDKQEVS